MKGESDAGVTWSSEVRFQEKIGNPIAGIEFHKIKTSRQSTVQRFCAMLRIQKQHALGWPFSIPPRLKRSIGIMASVLQNKYCSSQGDTLGGGIRHSRTRDLDSDRAELTTPPRNVHAHGFSNGSAGAVMLRFQGGDAQSQPFCGFLS